MGNRTNERNEWGCIWEIERTKRVGLYMGNRTNERNEWGCIWEIERRKQVGLYMGNRTKERSEFYSHIQPHEIIYLT